MKTDTSAGREPKNELSADGQPRDPDSRYKLFLEERETLIETSKEATTQYVKAIMTLAAGSLGLSGDGRAPRESSCRGDQTKEANIPGQRPLKPYEAKESPYTYIIN